MTSVVTALRAQLSEARVAISAGFAFGFAVDLESQQQGALNQAEGMINRLDTDLRQQVIAGTWASSKWLEVAQGQAQLIAGVVGDAKDAPTLSGFWSQVIGQSASDLADKGKSLANAVDSQLPFYVAAIVISLIAIAVIRVGRP